nr:1619_t:CDS:2 [Entrophospora candida]
MSWVDIRIILGVLLVKGEMKFNDKEQNSTVKSLNNYNVLRNNIKKLIKQLVELFMYKDEEDIDVDDAMKVIKP